jgi:hypothetical protein
MRGRRRPRERRRGREAARSSGGPHGRRQGSRARARRRGRGAAAPAHWGARRPWGGGAAARRRGHAAGVRGARARGAARGAPSAAAPRRRARGISRFSAAALSCSSALCELSRCELGILTTAARSPVVTTATGATTARGARHPPARGAPCWGARAPVRPPARCWARNVCIPALAGGVGAPGEAVGDGFGERAGVAALRLRRGALGAATKRRRWGRAISGEIGRRSFGVGADAADAGPAWGSGPARWPPKIAHPAVGAPPGRRGAARGAPCPLRALRALARRPPPPGRGRGRGPHGPPTPWHAPC